MASSPTVLIAAASGRALAMSARRAGYSPLVVDCFGDQDTIANADAHRRVCFAGGRGMQASDIITALDALAAGRDPVGIVCGTGFEDQPGLLACIAQRWTLIGNDARTVAQIKNPLALAALCDCCGIPHPDTITDPPQVPTGWLAKRIGGAGGSHIRLDGYALTAPGDFYYQRRVDGTPVSALVLANGHSAKILGFSTQWSSPVPQRPFRYGGAARPAELAPEIVDALAAAVQRLLALVPLVGLNSIDFLVEAPAFYLVEINPRPGATIDIFESQADGSLFALHVAACRGRLPAKAPRCEGAAAGAIVYAADDIAAMPPWEWPDWTADRPVAGSSIPAQSPFCTVFASATTVAQAKELVDRRSQAILARLRARLS